MNRHIHFWTVEVTRAPAPCEPADVQAFAFRHDKLVRDFTDAASSHRSKFANNQRNLTLEGFFERPLDAVLDGFVACCHRIVAFGRPPHVNRENQVVFGVCLQKLRAHVQQILFVLAPFIGVDHDRHTHARGAELCNDDVVGIEKFIGALGLVARFVTDVQNQVFLMIVNHLECFFAKPKFKGVAQAVPVTGRVMNFRDRNHAVGNTKRNNVVEVADAATSIPNNSYTVCASLCNFGNGLAFTIRPNKHVVYTTKNNLFVVLAIQKRILNEKARFHR